MTARLLRAATARPFLACALLAALSILVSGAFVPASLAKINCADPETYLRLCCPKPCPVVDPALIAQQEIQEEHFITMADLRGDTDGSLNEMLAALSSGLVKVAVAGGGSTLVRPPRAGGLDLPPAAGANLRLPDLPPGTVPDSLAGARHTWTTAQQALQAVRQAQLRRESIQAAVPQAKTVEDAHYLLHLINGATEQLRSNQNTLASLLAAYQHKAR